MLASDQSAVYVLHGAPTVFPPLQVGNCEIPLTVLEPLARHEMSIEAVARLDLAKGSALPRRRGLPAPQLLHHQPNRSSELVGRQRPQERRQQVRKVLHPTPHFHGLKRRKRPRPQHRRMLRPRQRLRTRLGDGSASRARSSPPLPGASAASASCLYSRGGGD